MFSSNTFVATFFFLISLLCGVTCCEIWIQFYPVPRTYEIPTFFSTKFFSTLSSVFKRLGYNF